MFDKEEQDFLDDNTAISTKLLKIVAALLLFVAVLGAVAFFSFDWAFSALVHTRAERAVPDITQKNVDTAIDLLANVNMALKKAGEEFQPDIPAGAIIRQLPPAGTIVREGKVVRVWVSQGKENIEVPDVANIPLRNAEFLLRQANLTIGTKETAYSLDIEKGNIISQNPTALSLVAKGATVNLVISNGAPNSGIILMPDFRHKKLADVNNWASTNNLEVSIKEDKDSAFPSGTIISQTPAGDSEVKTGAEISVIVSARPDAYGEKLHRLHYELPQGKNDNRVRIILIDDLGERELMNEMKQPGSKIDLTVPYGGNATFRIYVDGILVRQKELK